jgi:hypothetical protein
MREEKWYVSQVTFVFFALKELFLTGKGTH